MTAVVGAWSYVAKLASRAMEGGLVILIVVQPACTSPQSARSSPLYRTPLTSDKGVINLSKVLEVMSPQVRVERMGPATVEDLPRYHSLVERIDKVANRWRSTGRLMGPANIGDGYVLEVQIPLSGEEGNLVLGMMDRVGEASNSGSDTW